MNLAARDLGLPVGDFAAAAGIVVAGKDRVIDAAIAASHREEHVFLCACMLGTPARLGRHREQARARGGKLLQWPLFLRALVRGLRRPAALSAVLMVDGVAHRLRTPALTITVNELNDTEGHLFGRTRLDAGELCAYIVRRRRAWDIIRAFWRLALGEPRSSALKVLRGREMRLASPGAVSLRVMIDGEERLLKSPVQFSIRPGALRVFAP